MDSQLWNFTLMDHGRDANCSFFAVFSTFFKLQILVILSKMPQNTLFQGSLCVHFYGNKWKILFFKPKYLFFILKNTIFFRKRLASLPWTFLSTFVYVWVLTIRTYPTPLKARGGKAVPSAFLCDLQSSWGPFNHRRHPRLASVHGYIVIFLIRVHEGQHRYTHTHTHTYL